MKTNSTKYLLLVLITMFSCKIDYASDNNKGAEVKEAKFENSEAMSNYQKTDVAVVQNTAKTDPYKYFEDIDKNLGMVASRIKLPKDWERSQQQDYAFEGSKNMRIGMVQFANNQYYTDNYDMLYVFQQQGKQNIYPYEMDQIIQEFYQPNAQQHGMRMVSKTPLPQIGKKYQSFLEANFHSQPTMISVDAVGLEWEGNGQTYYTVIRRVIKQTQYQVSWTFNNQHIESATKDAAEAKKILIDAIMSEEFNTEWLHRVNAISAKRSNQMYQAHQARMATLNLNSTNSSYNKSIGDTYSDILDINHSGYLNNSNIQQAGHNKTVRMIAGQNIISNNTTGERYNVQSGSKYYWVNQNGKYIGTDNINYDPRMDKKINNMQWSQFNIEN